MGWSGGMGIRQRSAVGGSPVREASGEKRIPNRAAAVRRGKGKGTQLWRTGLGLAAETQVPDALGRGKGEGNQGLK